MNDEDKNDEDKMLFEEIENRCRLNFELRGKMSLTELGRSRPSSIGG